MAPKDHRGQRIGNFLIAVLHEIDSRNRRYWKAINAVTGEVRFVRTDRLTALTTMRPRRDNRGRARTDRPEYRIWCGMRSRCQHKRDNDFCQYGARGIKVCQRWQSFDKFYADMGNRPTPWHSIDRINNDGDYEPSNCRWATPREQAQNRRRRAVALSDASAFTKAEAA